MRSPTKLVPKWKFTGLVTCADTLPIPQPLSRLRGAGRPRWHSETIERFGSSSSATGCPTTLSVSRILAGLVQSYNFTLEHVALPTSAEDLQSAVDGVCRFNVKFREWCCLLRDGEAGGCYLGNSEESHNADRRSYLWPWVLNYSAAAHGEASSLGEPPRQWQCAKTEK